MTKEKTKHLDNFQAWMKVKKADKPALDLSRVVFTVWMRAR
jgi:hypothetical protein